MIASVTNPKGGVGKTTVAVHLAGAVAARSDRTVVLVDADPQQSATGWAGHALPNIRLESCCDPDVLLDALAEFADRGDADVVVDVAGTGNETHRAAMLHSDLTVLPTGHGTLDLRALADAIHLVGQVRRIRQANRPVTRMFFNKFQGHLRHAQEARAAATDLAAGYELVEASLGLRSAFSACVSEGMLVWDLPGAAPAAAEMRALTDQLLAGF